MTLKLPIALKERTMDSPFTYFRYDSDEDDFVVPFHYHEGQQIFRVIEGSVSISINSNPFVLKKGDFAIVPENCVHALYPLEKGTKFESVAFSLRELFDLSQSHYSLIKKIITHQIEISLYYSYQDNKELTDIAEELTRIVNSNEMSAGIIATAKVLELFGEATKLSSCKIYDRDQINRYYKYYIKSTVIYKYICDNYRREVTLEELANAVELSEKYFCKFFKELTDLRPMEFVNMFRIEAAAIELAISTDSINEVASRCGFKDPCYFTKLFRRFKGASPRDFRESIPNHFAK